MILVKNLLEPVGDDDGQRLSIEPFGLTLDLQEWCKVDEVLSHLGPPRELFDWFEEHPAGYDFFRAKYHDALAAGPYRDFLIDLIAASRHENFTLLHQGEDPAHNTATALYEFISELEAYAPPE